MNLGEAQSVAILLSAVLSIGSVVYTWLTASSRVNTAQIDRLSTALGELNQRLDRLEADMRHVPDKGATHRLEVQIVQMRGEISTLAERMQPVAAATELVREFLVTQARHGSR